MSKVLVTGGTGTIGRMVCRELASRGHEPVVFSRDPSKQLVNCPKMIHEVGRIEDEHFVHHVFRKHEVDGVIHTAANKHIGVCEDRPTEAVGANVLGSLNILRAVEEYKVGRAVFVSSDKACNHSHVYGITKYLMEKLVTEYAERLRLSKLNSVRFGNVFGSQGSVVPIWQHKINRGQDIDLRVINRAPGQQGGIRVPLRLAMLPSQAATFLVDVFLRNHYENGSVLMPLLSDLRTVNMRLMANVMVEGTRSKVREVPLLQVEAETERLYSYEESERVRTLHDALELAKHPLCEKLGCRTPEMTQEETREFVAKVLKEMNEWT